MKRQILPILILLLVLGCEVDRQKSVPIHKNSDNSSDVTKKVPKRSEVVKEENVLDDKVLYITGSDIYLNSSFNSCKPEFLSVSTFSSLLGGSTASLLHLHNGTLPIFI